jgi:alpha-tubulin suppressor-like RCC1 family protein
MQAVTAGWDELWAATPSSLYCQTLTSGEPSSRATAQPAQSCVRLSLPTVLNGAADARVQLLAAGTKHVVAVTRGGQCFSWGALVPAGQCCK